MGFKNILGAIGSVLLFIGVFLPIVSFPIVGSMNFMTNGNVWGILLLLIAVSSFTLAMLDKSCFLWLTGSAGFLFLLVKFIQISSAMGDISDSMSKDESGMFKALSEGMAASVQIQWGWAILLIGSACIVASAALKKNDDGKVSFDNESFGMLLDSLKRIWQKILANPKLKWGLLAGIIVFVTIGVATAIIQNLGQCPFGTEEVIEALPSSQAGTVSQWCRKQDDEGNYIKHGPFREIYTSGKVRQEGRYNNDVMEGLWIAYYENGQKMMEIPYTDGKQDGKITIWYENGKKKTQATWEMGELVSPFMAWDEMGNLLEDAEEFSQHLYDCAKGEGWGCYLVQLAYFEGRTFLGKPDIEQAKKYAKKMYGTEFAESSEEYQQVTMHLNECYNGDGSQCRFFANDLLEGKAFLKYPDREKAVSFFKLSCHLDDGKGCYALIFEYELYDQYKEQGNRLQVGQIERSQFLQKALSIHENKCLSGKGTDTIRDCHDAGFIYLKISGNKAKAKKFLKISCDYGYSDSCSLMDDM